ncbi:MAG: UDP-N-acetylglucosamine 1-carboxyvinyltransferase [Acidiferrobacteraceae bacterium]|nr:UDP-N-acetylglucosamine 1-carboxyvinyltransferase [Acidiferrobacteraceae bacterium]
MGARPIDLHLKGFSALGADIELKEGYVCATAKKLKGSRIYFDNVTVTGTMNVMMAAVLAEGETVLENSAMEPEVVFLADILNRAGAKIEGAGDYNIVIKGVSALKPLDCVIFPDRIEAGTYMIASAITKGQVEVASCVPEHLESLSQKLRDAGVEVEEGETSVLVRGKDLICPVDIETEVYPGFATDFQAQFMALMTLAEGSSAVNETVFENRFMHAAELQRMGADIAIEGHVAIVKGVQCLSGAPVMATDLRASASLLLAGLAARGQTSISRVYHIDRGYERMENKLSQIGARVKRLK